MTSDVPGPLIELVRRMMAKDPAGRPPDALALQAQLEDLVATTLPATRKPATVPPDEQPTRTIIDEVATEEQIVCVVLVTPMADDEDEEGPVTPDPVWLEEQGRIIQQAIEPYDGKLHSLADGSMVVTLAGEDTPTELATRAARCALAIREQIPESNIVVAAESSPAAAHSVGRVIDRGVRVMGQATISATFAELGGEVPDGADIWLDDTSARLLADQFEIKEARAGHRLIGARLS